LISKAPVRDRLLHKAIHRVLYDFFDKTFIYDSYSCRINKGTHRGFKRLMELARKISQNYTTSCYALKCDIKKFFDNIDHKILKKLLKERIKDRKLVDLLSLIIKSYRTETGKGLPLGNLTSQLFVNIYLDHLDKFIKHRLRAKHYLRYCDDFLLLGQEKDELIGYFIEVNQFLKNKLNLLLHPEKIILRKLIWGINFVGYNALPYYSLPRKKTIRRILKKIDYYKEHDPKYLKKCLPSYLGYLRHIDGYKLSCLIFNTPICGVK
jgi:retron-type reverse transcriptase